MCRKWLISGLLLFCSSCIAHSEMYPEEDDGAVTGETRVSIRYLKTIYTGYATPVTQPWMIQGWVTANDRYGSFPYTIWLEDDTGGLALKVGGEDLFVDYPVGQRLTVRCRGLVLGGYGGEVSLGAESSESGYQNAFIPQKERKWYLQGDEELEVLYPTTWKIEELTPAKVGTYVAFERLQFIEEELALAWCDPQVDTYRHLVNAHGDTLSVRTDWQADFADRILPQGSGYIEGILGYFNGRYQLRVITSDRVLMEAPRFQVLAAP